MGDDKKDTKKKTTGKEPDDIKTDGATEQQGESNQLPEKEKDVFPSAKYRWKKGQSGNPKGRPKGSGLTDTLKRILAEEDPDPEDPEDPKTVGQRLIETAVIHAKKGDFKFFQEIFNRVEGKVPDKIVGAFNHGIMDELNDEELREIITAGRLRDES